MSDEHRPLPFQHSPSQPQDQGRRDEANTRRAPEDPKVAEAVCMETGLPPLDMSPERLEAVINYLESLCQSWKRASSPAGQRERLVEDLTQEIRSQLGRVRHALEAELSVANACGDHQAIQIIHHALVRNIQAETELKERVEKWVGTWTPMPDLPCQAEGLRERLAADYVAEPVAFMRDLTDDALEEIVREWTANEKAAQSRASSQKHGEAVGWDDLTEARNKWIYEQAVKLVPWKTIEKRLKGKPSKWGRISSVSGIKKAARAYARRHGLPPPPARQPGRRSSR
jgi:hypothetical protein